MKNFTEDTDSNIYVIRDGSIARISKLSGHTTGLVSWAHGNPLEVLYSEGGLYILTPGRVSRVDVADFGVVTWSRTFSTPPLRIRVGDDVVVYGVNQNHLEKTLLDRDSGLIISTSFELDNVGNVTSMDLVEGVIVLAGLEGSKRIFVKYYGPEGWDAFYDTFGEIQADSLVPRIQPGGSILLGYNEDTSEGGWDPRIIMIDNEGQAVWTKNSLFATPDADRIVGVDSDGVDVFLIYVSEGGPMSFVRLSKLTGSVVYNIPIPPLSGIFGGEVHVFGADVNTSNNKLNLVFSSDNFVGGLGNSHPGPYLGMVKFSINDPLSTDAAPQSISVSGVDGFVFSPQVFDYAFEIENTLSNIGFSITNANAEQVSVVKVNGRTVQATQFSVPVGPTVFAVETTVGSQKTVYTFTITRSPPSGSVYVDMTNGSPNGRGTIMTPIKSLAQAMRLVDQQLVLRIKDFLPLFPQDNTFDVVPRRGGQVISKSMVTETVRVLNGAEDKIYALGVVPSLRSSINGKVSILSFFIKVYDEVSDQFVQNIDPIQMEFSLPSYFTRSELLLYREEQNGMTIPITPGPVKVEGSVFGLTLNSNSLYTLTDSDLFIPSAGIGSDPHITTIFGERYTLHKLSRYGRDLNILSTPHGDIRGKVTGLVNGEYLDSVDVRVAGENVLRVKFGSRGRSKIQICGPGVREIPGVGVRIEKFQNTARQNRVFLVEGLWENGVVLYVNDQHRYVCPIFRSQPPETARHLFGGMLCSKST